MPNVARTRQVLVLSVCRDLAAGPRVSPIFGRHEHESGRNSETMGAVAGTAGAIRLPWHDALLRLDNERTVQARSQTIAETNPPQTADQGRTAQEVARQPAQDGRIDGQSHEWPAQSLCRSRPYPTSATVRRPLKTNAHEYSPAAVPAGPDRAGGCRPSCRYPPAQGQHPAPLAVPSVGLQDPKEGPGAPTRRPGSVRASGNRCSCRVGTPSTLELARFRTPMVGNSTSAQLGSSNSVLTVVAAGRIEWTIEPAELNNTRPASHQMMCRL